MIRTHSDVTATPVGAAAKAPKPTGGANVPYQISLQEAQTLISESQLFEPQADALLRSLGFPESAAYLVLAYVTDTRIDLVPRHDLRQLLISLIHSRVLERPVEDVVRGVSAERPQFVDDEMFDRFQSLLTGTIVPLISDRNFQSIATSMLSDVIETYPIFDPRTRALLDALIRRAAETGQERYRRARSEGGQSVRGSQHRRPRRDRDSMARILDRFIAELRSVKHLTHPTKYERLLRLFEAQDYEPIGIQELAQVFFGDGPQTKRAMQYKLSKLNARLLPHGIQIERSTSYSLRLIP